MEPRLVITLCNMPEIEETGEMNQFIGERFSELRDVAPPMSSCTVSLEKTQQYQESGNPFSVQITITFPMSSDIVVQREPSGMLMHDPLHTTIHNAFVTAKQKILERTGVNQRTGARIQAEYGAVILKIFPERGYGFLQTDSGKEIFFRRSSVVGDEFDRMKEGMGVWFIEREGMKGCWASTVRICTPAS